MATVPIVLPIMDIAMAVGTMGMGINGVANGMEMVGGLEKPIEISCTMVFFLADLAKNTRVNGMFGRKKKQPTRHGGYLWSLRW